MRAFLFPHRAPASPTRGALILLVLAALVAGCTDEPSRPVETTIPEQNISWEVVTYAPGLNGVWALSATDVFAIGENGYPKHLVAHFDGQQLLPLKTMEVRTNDVWGTSASDLYVVGDGGMFHFDGKSWTSCFDEPIPRVAGVWGRAEDDVYAVGGHWIYRFNGQRWLRDVLAAGGMEDVWGTPDGHLYVAAGDHLVHFYGADREEIPVPSNATRVWAAGVGDVYLGCWDGVYHYDGAGVEKVLEIDGGWRTENTPVAGRSSDDVYALPQRKHPYHYDGTGWTEIDIPETQDLISVTEAVDGSMVFVGRYGRVVSNDGAQWTVGHDGPRDWFLDVWGLSPAYAIAVGYAGVAYEWDGSDWRPLDTGTLADFQGVWASSPVDVWAVAYDSWIYSTGAIYHYDGTAWTKEKEISYVFRDIWGAAPDDICAIGSGVFHYDGSDWSEAVRASGLSGVSGNAGDDVLAVGAAGSVLHYDGVEWTEVDVGPLNLRDVWALGTPGRFVAAGDDGVVWFDGSYARRERIGVSLIAVSGNAPDDIYAVGRNGAVAHYDGKSWQLVTTIPATQWDGVWANGEGAFACGWWGSIIELSTN